MPQSSCGLGIEATPQTAFAAAVELYGSVKEAKRRGYRDPSEASA